MAHLMCEDDSDLIFVCEIFVKSYVDAHVVPQRTECVEAVLIIDEVVVRTVIDGRVCCTDRCRKILEDAVELRVEPWVFVDAVFFLQLTEQLLTSLLCCVVIFDLLAHL